MTCWVTFGSNQMIQFSNQNEISFESIQLKSKLNSNDFRLLHNGIDVSSDIALQSIIASNKNSYSPLIFQIKFRIIGGKGGFGALLRSKRATVKTTNFGACRDLNGRRLRHVEQERALQEWQATAAQRENEKKRSELETKDNSASTTTTRFTDTAFATETIQYCDSVVEAIRSKRKSKIEEEEEEEDELDDDDEEEEKEEIKQISKKSKKLFDDDEFGDSSSEDEPKNATKNKNETK